MPRLVSLQHAADHLRVHVRTVHNYIGKGYFAVYERPGAKGWLVDLDEVDAAMRLIPTRKARGGKQFGPRARIVTLPVQAVSHTPEAGQ